MSQNSVWDNFKHTNINIMGVLGGEREQAVGNLFEKMTENFPKFGVLYKSKKHRESKTR